MTSQLEQHVRGKSESVSHCENLSLSELFETDCDSSKLPGMKLFKPHHYWFRSLQNWNDTFYCVQLTSTSGYPFSFADMKEKCAEAMPTSSVKTSRSPKLSPVTARTKKTVTSCLNCPQSLVRAPPIVNRYTVLCTCTA